MNKNSTAQLESIDERIRQLENQKRKILQTRKEQERKARTKRLIERGAILESCIEGLDALTNEQIGIFLGKTVKTEYARKAFAALGAAQSETTAERQAAE